MRGAVEFLRDRIAEESEVARDALGYIEGVHSAEPAERVDWHDDREVAILVPPPRFLAECEAKRWIITQYDEAVAEIRAYQRRVDAGGYKDPSDVVYGHRRIVLGGVLRELLRPYSDHPEFKSEWLSELAWSAAHAG